MQQEMHSPSGGKYVQHKKAVTERAKRAEFFISSETHFDGASEASGVLLAIKRPVAAERAKRAELFLFAINIHYIFIIEIWRAELCSLCNRPSEHSNIYAALVGHHHLAHEHTKAAMYSSMQTEMCHTMHANLTRLSHPQRTAPAIAPATSHQPWHRHQPSPQPPATSHGTGTTNVPQILPTLFLNISVGK